MTTHGAGGRSPYPPEPWRLRGWFCVSVFLVPRTRLPDPVIRALPPGARVLGLAGRAVVGVAAVTYVPGGVLDYDELLVALPVTHGRRFGVTIPQIWVTSAASLEGGRALWGIPKHLMTAHRHVAGRRLAHRFHESTDAAASGPLIADVEAATGRFQLPGRWTLPLPTVQHRDEQTITSRNTVRGVLRLASTRWRWGAPLEWLTGHRPLVSVAITRAETTFGGRTQRRRA